MNYQKTRLDTWIKTYALHPSDHDDWLNAFETLQKFKSVTFTLEPSQSTTGTEVSITLEEHETNPAT
jgi:hypothetical protein